MCFSISFFESRWAAPIKLNWKLTRAINETLLSKNILYCSYIQQLFVGNLDEEGWFIALFILWFFYLRLICLDNQSQLTNVFKLFRVVYRLCWTIYNGFIVANYTKQHCWSNFRRLLREMPRQIQICLITSAKEMPRHCRGK